MISQDSVSLPVRWRSTSPLKPSLGSSFALCNQVAQSNSSPLLRATLISSTALLQPTSRSCCFGIPRQILVNCHQIVGLPARFRETLLQEFVKRGQLLERVEVAWPMRSGGM